MALCSVCQFFHTGPECEPAPLRFTRHALARMAERGITERDVRNAVALGEMSVQRPKRGRQRHGDARRYRMLKLTVVLAMDEEVVITASRRS